MSFNTIVPNGAQSPGIFPAQNNANFTRLQKIISGDHQFNNSVAANDGCHKQATYINKPTDQLPVTSLPTGTNLMSFAKTTFDTVPDLWLFDGTNTQYQYTWRTLTGTVSMTTSPVQIVEIPQNCFGTIIMIRPTTLNVVYGYFVSNTTLNNTFNSAFYVTSVITPSILFFQSDSGLFIKGIASAIGTWNYTVQYRKYA